MFSVLGEYVVVLMYNNYEFYVWECNYGSLVCMFKDFKEEQGVIEWYFSCVLLVVCGIEIGCIYIWFVVSLQKWFVLVLDFVEVEENVEYIECEDEFDIYGQDEIYWWWLDVEDEDVDVFMDLLRVFDDGMVSDVFWMLILFNFGESDSEDEFIVVLMGIMCRCSFGEG